MEQRWNLDPVGVEESLDQTDQLLNQILTTTREAVLHAAQGFMRGPVVFIAQADALRLQPFSQIPPQSSVADGCAIVGY